MGLPDAYKADTEKADKVTAQAAANGSFESRRSPAEGALGIYLPGGTARHVTGGVIGIRESAPPIQDQFGVQVAP